MIGARHTAGCFLAGTLVALWVVACGRGGAKSKLLPQETPRLALQSVLGIYTGSIRTPRGTEAVMLQVQEIALQHETLVFRYTLKSPEQREDGLGTLRPGETSTRVCFAEEICGWLLSEDGDVRIVADSGDLEDPPWSLEKSLNRHSS